MNKDNQDMNCGESLEEEGGGNGFSQQKFVLVLFLVLLLVFKSVLLACPLADTCSLMYLLFLLISRIEPRAE